MIRHLARHPNVVKITTKYKKASILFPHSILDCETFLTVQKFFQKISNITLIFHLIKKKKNMIVVVTSCKLSLHTFAEISYRKNTHLQKL